MGPAEGIGVILLQSGASVAHGTIIHGEKEATYRLGKSLTRGSRLIRYHENDELPKNNQSVHKLGPPAVASEAAGYVWSPSTFEAASS